MTENIILSLLENITKILTISETGKGKNEKCIDDTLKRMLGNDKG